MKIKKTKIKNISFLTLAQIFTSENSLIENAKNQDMTLKEDQKKFLCIKILADNGDAIAQLNLGLMYFNGLSAPQNYPEAHRLFLLSRKEKQCKRTISSRGDVQKRPRSLL